MTEHEEYKCCNNCFHFLDALCSVTDEFDDEEPDTFSCKCYEKDDEC